MLRTTLRRVQLSPRSAVSPFVCIFCQKKGPNLERRLTTKDVGQSNSVEPPPTTNTSASSLKKSVSVMDILKKDMLERKEGRNRKKSAKKAKAAEKKESKKARAAEKKEPKKSKAGKKMGVSLFQAEAAVARSPKKKKALQRARGSTMPGISLSEALEEKVGDIYKYEVLDPKSREIETIEREGQPEVARLSHNLDRVLFNPGVHYLQEPRSRVYNFDPYLQEIMPVTEFDFDAVASYIVSSEDHRLSSLAKELGKKYVGSTSSMTAVLSHFHFLLSQWRPLNFLGLSKTFRAEFKTFTQITRAPAAIFLRYKGNGTYAIDPDKEYDTDSVLSLLGRSMEKLLTTAPSNFESKYKKGSPRSEEESLIKGPETYHYSTLGDILMRSQLDAHDPRLPGTGMFDLKTRAVVSVRMDVANFHIGSGYQIKTRVGTWESFEREYYDMMRAAFLKYSLQVRMGRMDGIFVAFHNTEKIFGFQYVSLDEMDAAIHEDWDTGIGDQEFRLSLQLFNKALDNATKKYPEKSLHLHFEARDTARNPMVIVAEPMDEEEVERRQTRNKRDLADFLEALDKQMKGGEGTVPSFKDLEYQEGEKEAISFDEDEGVQKNIQQEEEADDEGVKDHGENDLQELEESESEEDGDLSDVEDVRDIEPNQGVRGSIEEDAVGALEGNPKADTGAIGLARVGNKKEVQELEKFPEMYVQLMYIRNYVNEKPVPRPTRLKEDDSWKVAVAIDELPPKPAYMTNIGVVKRRKRAIEHRMITEDDAEAGAYIRQLRNMSRAGRDWAKTQEEMFPGEPVLYKPRLG
ncbi:mitochondrial protein Pet127-domain-containing protein [Tuber borchii]|uniref:Mitochondrial protein Pet127-domain-containing protein n=1 Tax=Tuber borchii TaxID=42251 RepID=A0A2T6ZYL4_TUBBO|nr:mitochondrial protein Pet127-domain-containing protein [Tuber borchii]